MSTKMTPGQIDTHKHIAEVGLNLSLVVVELEERKRAHDASKLKEPELSGYEGLNDAVKGLTYGSAEYRAAFEPFKPIIQHHYANNTHHPEHWPNGVADMSLLDIIEMLCDWKAASARNNGDFKKSLEISIARFHFDDDRIGEILMNTARELGWI